MKRYRPIILSLIVVGGLLTGLLLPAAAVAQGPDTQLVMVLDGSGSISSADWTLILNGLAAAVEDSMCVPQDGSVELTVIQFAANAKLEVGPVVVSSAEAASIANQIRSIPQMGGATCIACGLCLAQDVLLNHPDAQYDASIKQAINLVTDGEPNRCADCGDCTGGPDWTCPPSSTCVSARASAEAARDYALSQLAMTVEQDEIDAEFIGTSGSNSDWLRDSIVWPEPGYYAPPFDQGPGWVRVVADANEFAETICEKFQRIVPDEPVGGISRPAGRAALLAPWLVGVVGGGVVLVGLSVLVRRRGAVLR